MARMGMDVEQVEGLAAQLKNKAHDLQGLITSIDGLVHNLHSNWDGHDADVFANEWWPQHKSALQNAATSVEGLGQSAQNNANAQRQVSQG
jgi:WXG100 family type VII secretion target